jgi:hypothetical protein
VENRRGSLAFQGVGGSGENLLLVFPAFHGTAISTAPLVLRDSRYRIPGG